MTICIDDTFKNQWMLADWRQIFQKNIFELLDKRDFWRLLLITYAIGMLYIT